MLTRVKRVELSPGVAPWKRQPGEAVKAFEAFEAYRDLGPGRTLADLAGQLGKSVQHIYDLSSAGQWRTRLDAWLEYQDSVYEQEFVQEAREAARQDAALLRGALAKVGRELMALEGPLSADQTIRLLDATLKHRRSLYGDPLKTSLAGPGEQAPVPQVNVEIQNFMELPEEAQRAKLREVTLETQRYLDAAENAEDE